MTSFRFTRKQVIGLVVGVGVLAAGAAGATGLVYDVYARRADDVFARKIGSVLPAAKVGKHTVTYGDFLKSRDTLRTYMSSPSAKQEGLSQPITPDIEKSALDRLVREAIVNELAEKNNVKLSDDEVKDAFSKLVETTSSTMPDVGKYLRETFNWDENEFRANVMRPALMEQRVAESLTTSTAEQGTALDAYFQDRLAKPDVKFFLKFGPDAGATK